MSAMKQHTDREYASELRKVHENLLRMAGQVEQMIADASRSLVEHDQLLASKTIDADHKVNRIEVDTDEACLLILAKRQPMATDLRFITLAMKMLTDLERIGDLAVNISERTLALDCGPTASVSERVTRMSQIVQGMVRDATDAFVARDVSGAEEIFARDEEVDDLYRDVTREIQHGMFKDPQQVEPGIHFSAVVKFLERIGDHANNLAELAIFLVKGKDIRHVGKLEPTPQR